MRNVAPEFPVQHYLSSCQTLKVRYNKSEHRNRYEKSEAVAAVPWRALK